MMGLVCLGIVLAVIVGATAVICFLIWIIGTLSDWSKVDNDCARMKFWKWFDLYMLNKGAWGLSSYGPTRIISRDGYCSEYVSIKFSYWDYLRYLFWFNGLEKRKGKQKSNEKLAKVLKAAQDDIELLKQKADKEMEEAEQQVREINRRMREV